jgi:NAD(P)H-dependent FMN reductase
VSHINPAEFPLLEKPHFAYAQNKAPPNMQKIHTQLLNADCYVCVTPEYNHSPSPALLNTLNHFGSSTFSFKPSAIVTYSAGQWGGVRAAVALRATLGEVGCLPVSAMIHIPRAQDVLDMDGRVISQQQQKVSGDPKEESDDEESRRRWQTYCGRCFSQLEWWADATIRQRAILDPFTNESPIFVTSPEQRSAPSS